ncbi:hypothetical protein [Streptomyces flavofungini]|uniref:hypothetical protein n=1 Tax=Streptomyces flavofungini TaxID=68200 RepID=UPI0025AFFCA8|nr:hypothetical protein [Streptomyces flavofungini]WJV46089.1 hypothetical protein QUY26_11430 [Streptomyces flavofungini]
MSVTLTDQDKSTLRTAAYGAVALMAAADATGKPGKVAAEGSVALTSATGLVGHVLADYPKESDLSGKSVADIADRVLPDLTAAMALLKKQDPAEAANFRTAVLVAVETAARAAKGQPSPVLVDMNRKITEALDAA